MQHEPSTLRSHGSAVQLSHPHSQNAVPRFTKPRPPGRVGGSQIVQARALKQKSQPLPQLPSNINPTTNNTHPHKAKAKGPAIAPSGTGVATTTPHHLHSNPTQPAHSLKKSPKTSEPGGTQDDSSIHMSSSSSSAVLTKRKGTVAVVRPHPVSALPPVSSQSAPASTSPSSVLPTHDNSPSTLPASRNIALNTAGSGPNNDDWKKRVEDSSDAVSRGFSTLRARIALASDAITEKWSETNRPLTLEPTLAQKKMLFGLPIELVMEKYPPDYQLPPFIEKICLYIEQALITQEGIFRLAGSKAEIDLYKAKIDAGEEVRMWEMPDHAVCDLFKIYIRSLPDCLLTEELYDCFMAKATVAVTEKTTVDLAGLLNTIPACNRFLLKRLLLLLNRVAAYAQYNKMTAANLALIFGPNLLQAPQGSLSVLTDMPLVNQVAANLIANCEELFKDTHLLSHYIGFVQATKNYVKQSDNELSFQKGDILWLIGRNVGGFSKGQDWSKKQKANLPM
eukprot:TRINITY_DN9053_c0_g1_i3.p1 TRINITY_DN9053_c0_g1~~TRINITY_DN9053_c0_g1_i3.p1  ORF type:complete len:508 (-),score=67.27 TRINITY_DN9053_c0_g1_i3:548-2071(-)